MWCPTCRADVAAELSTDNRRMLCTRCHADLGIAAGASASNTATPRAQETERDARELLARWSVQNVLEPPAKPAGKSSLAQDQKSLATEPGFDHARPFDHQQSAASFPTSSLFAAIKDRKAPGAVVPMAAQTPAPPVTTNYSIDQTS